MTAEDAALSGASAEGPLALAKPTGPLVEVRVHVAHRGPMTKRYGKSRSSLAIAVSDDLYLP